MKYYIAYGSNMSKEQMRYRCPNAKLVGTGRVYGMQLEFYAHATIQSSEIKEHYVPVAVWNITPKDEERLDGYEGFPRYYTKDTCTVHMSDGSQIKGMVYMMKAFLPYRLSQSYYEDIHEAYIDLGLGSEIERALEPALKRYLQRPKCNQT